MLANYIDNMQLTWWSRSCPAYTFFNTFIRHICNRGQKISLKMQSPVFSVKFSEFKLFKHVLHTFQDEIQVIESDLSQKQERGETSWAAHSSFWYAALTIYRTTKKSWQYCFFFLPFFFFLVPEIDVSLARMCILLLALRTKLGWLTSL